MRVQRVVVWLAIAFAVALGSAGVARAQAPSAESPVVRGLAAEAYAREFGVPYEEAWRRVAIQAHVVPLRERVVEVLGERWSGDWWENGDRFGLMIGVARGASERVQRASELIDSAGERGRVALVTRASSFDELVAAQRKVDETLSPYSTQQLLETGVDPITSSIRVRGATALTDEQRQYIEDLSVDGVPVNLEMTDASRLVSEEQDCGFANSRIFCGRPLRGGVKITSDQNVAAGIWGCTAGFMARSRVDTALYLMTAGHCLKDDPSTWRTRNAGGTLHAIGEAYEAESAPGAVDAGIIRVPIFSHWHTNAGYGRVVVTRSADTTRDELYPITGESSASLGQMLCMTGSRPFSDTTDFTRCGSVIELNFTANYPAGDMHGLRVLNICGVVDGQSGAPNYIGRRAYGIHSGKDEGCRALMMDIQRAEDAMNVDLLHE